MTAVAPSDQSSKDATSTFRITKDNVMVVGVSQDVKVGWLQAGFSSLQLAVGFAMLGFGIQFM